MKINVAICDDNEAFIHQLKNTLKNYIHDDRNSYCFYSFLSGRTLINKIQKHFCPDIIFLDIDLNESMLGTSVGILAKEIHPDTILIYLSSYSCYYKELAQAEPFCFLSKPIEPKDLQDAFIKAMKRIYYIKQEFIFTYKSNGINYKVDLKKVMYFESQHRIINIHTDCGKVYQFYEKLDELEKKIEEMYPYFLRVNKSYYVNYNYVENFSRTCISINGLTIKKSAKYKKRFSDKLFFLL